MKKVKNKNIFKKFLKLKLKLKSNKTTTEQNKTKK